MLDHVMTQSPRTIPKLYNACVLLASFVIVVKQPEHLSPSLDIFQANLINSCVEELVLFQKTLRKWDIFVFQAFKSKKKKTRLEFY